MQSNPTSTSGIGFSLEHYVQASYLASLMLGIPVPLKKDLSVVSLKFQARRVAETDDLIVELQNGGTTEKHFVQSKKGFEVNANKTFNDLIKAAWTDFTTPGLFNPATDKFIITTEPLSKTEITNTQVLLDWARFSSDENDFISKVSNEKSKEAKLNHFKKAIEAAKGSTPTDLEVFTFLKCFYIQDYDYLIQGGRDKEVLKWYLKPYLISGTNEEQGLSQLLDFIYTANQNQATFTRENVTEQAPKIFQLSISDNIGTELKGLLKKSVHSLVHSVFSEIQGYHIDRTQIVDKVIETIATNQFTILEGEAGIGKSGILKDLTLKLYNNQAGFIYLKADLLDRNTLAETLTALGITSDFETLASQWVLLPQLIIYVDSFEKLYESEKKGAFLEFVGIIRKFRKIKVVAACRKYAVNDLMFKYKLGRAETGIQEIPDITDEELDKVVSQFPSLEPLKAQDKLKKLIRKPFYLDVAVQIAENLPAGETIDETTFKNKLWEILIERKGNSSAGVSVKRASAFTQIILKRAKEKRQYVEPDNGTDEAALESLLNDGLLVKNEANEYAPSHDILEDLAVTRHINKLYSNKENISQFVQELSFYPVFRRGIRIWINEQLDINLEEITQFIHEVLKSEESQFIRDEILLAILGSDKCSQFLEDNKELFIADNLKLFERLMLLLNVAFVEDYKGEQHKRNTKTFGYGWNAVIAFIGNNYSRFPKGYDVLLVQILDKASLQFEIGKPLPDEAKVIANHCLRLIGMSNTGISLKTLLIILFRVAEAALNDIEDMLYRAITAKEQNDTTGINVSFGRMLFEMVLVNTTDCINLYRLIPDIVIRIAGMEWFKEPKVNRGLFGSDYDTDYSESSWGIKSYPYKYFNASAYQTPFRYLFKYHPEKAIEFFIEVVNRGVTFYSKSDYAKQSETKLVQFQLQDGSSVEQFGDHTLWAIHRGMGHVPDLIESIHMALEEFLMNCVEQGIDIKPYANQLLRNVKCVSVTSVLTSVVLRYPYALGNKVLSLLKVREFFAWDLSRYSRDFINTSSELGNDAYYVKERQEANRMKFRRTNMESLVTTLQLYGMKEVSDIIDQHKSIANPEDNYWLLALERMDVRNKTPEYKEDEGILLLNPNPLPKQLQEFVDEGSNEQSNDMLITSAFLWAEKAFKGELESPYTYSDWKKNYEQVSKITSSSLFLRVSNPKPKLAAIGLRNFLTDLTPEEKTFCTNQICTMSDSICDGYRHYNSYNDILTNGVVEAFPLLLRPELSEHVSHEKYKNQILEHLIFFRDETAEILIKGINHYLWQFDPVFGETCLQVLMKLHLGEDVYQKLRNIHPRTQGAIISEIDFDLIKADYISAADEIDLNNTGFQSDNLQYLLYIVKAIPYERLNDKYFNLFKRIIDKGISAPNTDESERSNFTSDFKWFLGRYLLDNGNEKATEILLILLNQISKNAAFVFYVIKNLFAYGHDDKYPENLWKHFLTIFYFVSKSPIIGLINALLFSSYKNYKICNKLPVNEGKNIHRALIENCAIEPHVMPNIFKLLAGVGSVYQPYCLEWLKKGIPNIGALRAGFTPINFEIIEYVEAFVEQIYSNHISYLHKNKEIKEYYKMYLDVLIDYKSIIAFRIREELI